MKYKNYIKPLLIEIISIAIWITGFVCIKIIPDSMSDWTLKDWLLCPVWLIIIVSPVISHWRNIIRKIFLKNENE